MQPLSSLRFSASRARRLGACAGVLFGAGALATCGAHEQPAVGFGMADWGRPNVRVAREEIGSWPGRGGPLIAFDSTGRGEAPDIEVNRALTLVTTPGLVAVVGHGGSRGSRAAAPVYNEAGVVQIVPTGTSRMLRAAGSWTLAMAPSDSVEAEFIATFVTAKVARARVTVFFENDEYGRGLQLALAAALMPRGVTTIAEQPYSERSDLDDVVALAARRGRPNVVIIVGRAPQATRIAALSRRVFGPLPIVCSDGVELNPQTARESGAAHDDIYAVAFWHPSRNDSVSAAFVRRFERVALARPSAAQAMRHDALMVAATAVREAGPDPAAVRDWLLSLGRERPPYAGVTGPISFGGRTGPLLMISARADSVVMEQH